MAVLFSAVTLTADNNQVEFLAAGIPRDSDDLEGWTAYENFMDELDSEQEVSVHVEAYLYGEGETFKATPFEIRQRVGFSYNDVLSFTEAPDGRTVIVKREKICDNCAAEKPQRKDAEDTITLFDFLNSLSDEQQKAAFAHLKLKWDHVQGSGLYGRS